MTHSSNPKAPKNTRKKPAREPATLDLKATVVDEGLQQDKAWDDVKPEETITPEPGVQAPGVEAHDTVGAPEATLDSGTNADSIESVAPAESIAPGDEASPRFEESGPGGPAPEEPRPDEPGSVPPSPAPTPERRSSPAALIGSGLLGGLVGAGLVYALQASQPAPAPQADPRVAQLEQRVNALGQPGPQNQAVDLSPIEGRIKALEEARGSLDQRLQAIQDTANGAASKADEALNRPQPQPPAPQNEQALTDLSNRLSALEDQMRTNAQSAADAANKIQETANKALAASNKTSEDVQGLDRRLAEQDQRLTALSGQVTQNSQAAETAGQTGTRVVLTERVSDALRSGTPYADVLEALRKTGIDAGKLKPLEPFAEKGAPTASAMLDRFEPLEAQILRDERAASGEWSDRVLRMLDKVVTVRPVNEPSDTGVSATLARIRQALAQGDMVGAAAAWESLPEPARRISEEWGRQVTAVAGARQASGDLSEAALSDLNRSTQ